MVNIVEHRVIGTKYEVGWCILQNFVNLGLQILEVTLLECLTTIVESPQHGTAKELTDFLQAETFVLPVVEWWVNDTAGIVLVVVERRRSEVTTALADMQDIERSNLGCQLRQLDVIGLDDVSEYATSELLQVVALRRDIETVCTCLASLTDLVEQTLCHGFEGRLDGFGILLDQFYEMAASFPVARQLRTGSLNQHTQW